ncbi:7941_t:CDS:2 [Diversispora eburnea]|uniref:7941_t:CDS:1 n=1 Tax=Diversispora eburnea TaxID=1213867 RepID=A0A9N9C1N7_9GLOM|nr:7941_t:CDS:2 [Diversispora eburnea]
MNLENSDILFLASSFTQLSSLHYSHLKRPNNSPKQVKSTFDNFDELRIFSFNCGKGLDVDKLLCQMGKNIPESLETIEIRIDYDFQWNFSADSLRKFFEGWSLKRGGDKKVIVNNTEHSLLFTLGDEHFKVIEEHGVQFDIEEAFYLRDYYTNQWLLQLQVNKWQKYITNFQKLLSTIEKLAVVHSQPPSKEFNGINEELEKFGDGEELEYLEDEILI